MRKIYNTPKRHCVIKTRLTDEERADFEERCHTYSISQSEFIRQAIFYGKVSPVIKISATSEEMLKALSTFTTQLGKIGGNLNQIARHLNEGNSFYPDLQQQVRNTALDLADLKFEILKMVGEAYGNDKTYRL